MTFALLRLAPGDPFLGERSQSAEALEVKKRRMKLDGPLWWQMARYYGDLVHGDLRESTKYKGARGGGNPRAEPAGLVSSRSDLPS